MSSASSRVGVAINSPSIRDRNRGGQAPGSMHPGICHPTRSHATNDAPSGDLDRCSL